jgi:hypothetical protein
MRPATVPAPARTVFAAPLPLGAPDAPPPLDALPRDAPEEVLFRRALELALRLREAAVRDVPLRPPPLRALLDLLVRAPLDFALEALAPFRDFAPPLGVRDGAADDDFR